MKKCTIWLLALVLAATMAVPALAETPADALGEGLRVGTYELGVELDALVVAFTDSQLEGSVRSASVGEIMAVQSLAEAQMLLESGRLDAFVGIWETVAYVAARNDRLMAVRGPAAMGLQMVLPKEDEALAGRIDEALAALRAEGAVDALYAAHVQAVLDGAEPVAVAMPVIEGGETIVVGVSGDTPPIDFTTADGQAAGFNTALLAALAEKLGMNVELVTMESGAKFTALLAGRIDAFFWHITLDANVEAGVVKDAAAATAASDISDRFALTDSYWVTNAGWLLPAGE